MSFEHLMTAYRQRRAEAARIAAAEYDRARQDTFRKAMADPRGFTDDEWAVIDGMLTEMGLAVDQVGPLIAEVSSLRTRYAKLDEARAAYTDACRWGHPELYRVGADVTDCCTAYERLVALSLQYPLLVEHPGPFREVEAAVSV